MKNAACQCDCFSCWVGACQACPHNCEPNCAPSQPKTLHVDMVAVHLDADVPEPLDPPTEGATT